MIARAVAPLPDPRRPGAALALVECHCGRAYCLTGPELLKAAQERRTTCPDPDCGKGAE